MVRSSRPQAGGVVDFEAAARTWADTWSRAWPEKNAEAIARLYADTAAYRSHPFREPKLGQAGAREYALSVFAEEDGVECRFGKPIVQGARAAVEWWATFRSEGKEWTLAGTTILRFDADGKVAEHCDYWVMDEGRRPLPGWAT